jgi:hypothetical protein
MKRTIDVVCAPATVSPGEDWFAAYGQDMPAAHMAPFLGADSPDPRKLVAHVVPITVEQHIAITIADPAGAVREVEGSPDIVLTTMTGADVTERRIDPDGNVETRHFRLSPAE